MSINKVLMTGNLTRDAELRSTPNGTAVLNVGVAVNDRRRDQQTGEWNDYANFIDCSMFGRRAEGIVGYLKKGTKVAIEGRLHYSSWEDKNTGQRRSKVDVTIDEIEFMSVRNRDNSQQGGYDNSYSNPASASVVAPAASNAPATEPATAPVAPSVPEPPTPAAYNDEDIPF